MPDPERLILDWSLISIGLALTHFLILYSEFHSDAQGYMLLAARKIWYFLTLAFGIEAVIGLFLFYVGTSKIPGCPKELLALLTGILVAAIPSGLERILLPEDSTADSLQKPLTKVLLKLNIIIRYKFAWAIGSRREQDVFDCQCPDAWGTGLPKRVVGRRLRIIYEIKKLDIAKRRKDPAFLRYDEGRSPWEKFYLLVRLMGRKSLRHFILNPPNSPGVGWDGRERRKKRGTRQDRRDDGPGDPASRSYDDAALAKRIRDGLED